MLANLQQIPPWGWAIVIIAIIVLSAIIFWARQRRWRVSEVEITTGLVKTKLKPDEAPKTPATSNPPAVNISRNTLLGKTNIGVRRERTNISENLTAGETDIQVGAKPGPKPGSKKGKSNR